MNKKLQGQLFPFIPLLFGVLVILAQVKWGIPNTKLPIHLMFTIIIACMISWLFSTIGLLMYQDSLLSYYINLYKILSMVYFLPALILALFLPWTGILSLSIFISGIIIIRRHKPKAK